MSSIYRVDDTGKIESFRETVEGFLDLNLSFSKAGPLEYRRADGRIETEYLTEEELFNEESLVTATGKPVTFMHPPEGMITKDNVRRHSRGSTGTKIIKDTPFATIVATIHDAELIDAIKTGRTRQVSAGYTTNVVKGDDGKLYQKNRVYNHFAVCETGRAGPDVRVHYDSPETDLSFEPSDSRLIVTPVYGPLTHLQKNRLDSIPKWQRPLRLSTQIPPEELLGVPKHERPLRLSKISRGHSGSRVENSPRPHSGPFDHLKRQN